MVTEALLSLEEAATTLLQALPRSLADKRFRSRIGLPAVKIGRRVAFRPGDVEQLIARRVERLPKSAFCL